MTKTVRGKQKLTRGRDKGVVFGPEHRSKIVKSKIFNRLIACAEGNEEKGNEMTPQQIQVALALMKKVMPDLQAIEVTGNEDNPVEVVHKIQLVGKRASKD